MGLGWLKSRNFGLGRSIEHIALVAANVQSRHINSPPSTAVVTELDCNIYNLRVIRMFNW